MFKFFQKKETKKVAPLAILCCINDDRHLEHREVGRIRDYCVNHELGFRIREYNIDAYQEDFFVKRFPTFHIYYKGGYSESFDMTDEPLFKIKERIEEWETEEKEKARKKEQWEAKKKLWKRKWLGIEERPPPPALPKSMPQMEDT